MWVLPLHQHRWFRICAVVCPLDTKATIGIDGLFGAQDLNVVPNCVQVAPNMGLENSRKFLRPVLLERHGFWNFLEFPERIGTVFLAPKASMWSQIVTK